MVDNYHLTRKNASFDFLILHQHLWGGRFQMSMVGERQIIRGKGRSFAGQEVWIWSD
jgi:hypothetical protein